MVDASSASSGRIFISYRREETGYAAGWLYDRLTDRFGHGQVFKDVDSIELGDDFVEAVTRAVGSCDVLLALIGDRWLTITDAQGRRRLDDPDDFLRLEIEAALSRNVRVVPILVDGARIPAASDLPESLVRLVRRQALELSPSSFEFDTDRLLRVLDSTLAEVRSSGASAAAAATVPPATPPPPPPAGGDGNAVDAGAPGPPHRALSTRTRALLAAGLAVLLIVLIVVVVRANTSSDNSTVQGNGTVQGPAAAPAAGAGLELDSTPVTTPDGVRLTDLAAASRNNPPRVGDTVTVTYSLTNIGTRPVQLDFTFVGVRNGGTNKDTEDGNEGVTLVPGQTISATGRVFVDHSGRWDVWPCYAFASGGFCPDKWQAFSFIAE